MNQQEIITNTISFVRNELKGAEAGHDWSHIERVWKNAKTIALQENVNGFVVELGSLLHDIADSKFHNGDEEIGPKKAASFLTGLGVNDKIVQEVQCIIRHISFKGGNFKSDYQSTELAVVQDADRLDAIGAIGIARAFHYGGFKNRPLYDREIPPNLQMTKEEYKHAVAPTLNHFYEKLLRLKDLMHFESSRKMAEERHRFMEDFLSQFLKEWNCA